MSRITVTVERLALRGLEAEDGKALVEGLRGELARVLADPAGQAEWARAYSTPVLRLGSMPWQPGRRGSRNFGGGIAVAIRKGLKE
jgi:hypothetical protein